MVRRFIPSLGGLESWARDFTTELIDRACSVRILTTVADRVPAGATVTFVKPAQDVLAQARLFDLAARDLHGEIIHDTGVGLSSHIFHPQMGCQTLNFARDVAARSSFGRLKVAVSPRAQRLLRNVAILERQQVQSARHVVAVSNETASIFRTKYGVADARMTIIPNGIDTSRFQPARAATARAETRLRMDIPEPAMVLLAAGNNFRLKGVHHTIRALAETEGAVLLVAGSGDVSGFRRIAARAGVVDRVRFLGHVDDMPSLYGAADIFVHPTAHDACSLATLEAMACGLPTITTRNNGAADGMRHGYDGYVLDDLTTEAVTRAIRTMSNPEARRAMGQRARKLAERHAFAAIVDRLMSVHRSISMSP